MEASWDDDNFGYAKVDDIGLSSGYEGYLLVIGLWKGKYVLVGFIDVYKLNMMPKMVIVEKVECRINSIETYWSVFGYFNEVRIADE